jgi:hypothetical protein
MSNYTNNTVSHKDITIIRQSSLKWVHDYLRMVGTPCTMKEVIKMSEIVTKYVVDGPTKEVMEKFAAIDKHLMGKYEE